MAMSFEEFVAASSAELVAGNLIVGVGPERTVVGSIADGAFVLNDAGNALLADLESPTPKRGRKAAAE